MPSGASSALEFDGFHQDAGGAFVVKPEFFGGAGAQVDDPAIDEGTAIIDPHDDFSFVLQVDDAHEGGQGQKFVGGVQAAAILPFRSTSMGTGVGSTL